MKKVLLWILPIFTLAAGIYIGLIYKKPIIENSPIAISSVPLFAFETPAGYEGQIENNNALLWKEGRPKPLGDSDAQADLSVWVHKTNIADSQFASAKPTLLRSFMVNGFGAGYYKLSDEQAGNPYLVVIDMKDGSWIYIETVEQKLLDEVLATFKVKNSK
jgi:hypothetical protein